MKLFSFRDPSDPRAVRLGASGDGVRFADVTSLAGLSDMVDLIEQWERWAPTLAKAPANVAMESVELLAPIPRPRRNIFCIGKNYREHALEFGRSGFDGGAKGGDEIPEAPIVFSKPPSAVVGPGAGVPAANDPTGSLDYEGELAVVIGRGGRGIRADRALDHVFGYTIVNDLTSRDLQKHHKQWLLGKGIDGFCPMGPVIATADEVGPLASLRLTTDVNGERRQDASLAQLIFDVPTLVQAISALITLESGRRDRYRYARRRGDRLQAAEVSAPWRPGHHRRRARGATHDSDHLNQEGAWPTSRSTTPRRLASRSGSTRT